MIKRYSRPEMARIWSDENRFAEMLRVEIFACEAQAKLGKVPAKALARIKKSARVDASRIREIEKKTNHDVIAFIQNIAEEVGDASKYVHMGLTSSDVLDTALSVQMRSAADLLIADAKRLLAALRRKARRYKMTPMIGRTHSVHAEPITFGLKMALFYDEMTRALGRLERARDIVSVGKISGAVGTYANIDPFVEKYVCRKLGLEPDRISTQIIQRDRHAEYLTAIALVGGTLEKLATEIRNLQHTEIGEVEEYFSSTQKGSSAMPHKRNPIMSERLCGMARLLRANAHAALESMALWHERDISHSSVERVVLPDSTILLDYMLDVAVNLVERLNVNADAMKRNLERSQGVIFSQRVLLALIDKGFTRDEAYVRVQKLAFRSKSESIGFKEALGTDGEFGALFTKRETEGLFSLDYHLRNVGRIFRQVGI